MKMGIKKSVGRQKQTAKKAKRSTGPKTSWQKFIERCA
jgi:hypothetical protein